MLDRREVLVEVWLNAGRVRGTRTVRLTHVPTGTAVERREHGARAVDRDAAMAELERRVADATR